MQSQHLIQALQSMASQAQPQPVQGPDLAAMQAMMQKRRGQGAGGQGGITVPGMAQPQGGMPAQGDPMAMKMPGPGAGPGGGIMARLGHIPGNLQQAGRNLAAAPGTLAQAAQGGARGLLGLGKAALRIP